MQGSVPLAKAGAQSLPLARTGGNRLSLGPSIPAFAQGCPGESLRQVKGGNRPADFVLAGLGPWAFSPRTRSVGIHAFRTRNKDVDARIKSAQDDLSLISTTLKPLLIGEKIRR